MSTRISSSTGAVYRLLGDRLTTCKGLANRWREPPEAAGVLKPTRTIGGALPLYKSPRAARQCPRSALASRFSWHCTNLRKIREMPIKTSLAAHGIACQRGGRLLFADLSFTLEPGQGLLVTGPNGAGKTSLLRLIARLLPLAAGSFESGDTGLPLPELCHYVGHANGIKSTHASRECRLLGGLPRRRRCRSRGCA